ncbi:MAG: hypothetical protein JXA93_16280 [Anaerolineae bacterium]|nr:hypothetical protein [Anaerolineae bacterium]
MRRVITLNGDDWRLGRAPRGATPNDAAWSEIDLVGAWLPATVPGNVRADLARAGQLPDLHYACQFDAARWVDDHCWWLVRDWPHAAAPGERVHLLFHGLDYQGSLWINGHSLGRFEGMFAPRRYDVTSLLASENRLAVRLDGPRWLPGDRSTPRERFLNQIEARFSSLSSAYPHRRDTLKCQMSFGWDFAPPLPTLGLWDDVLAVVTGGLFVEHVAVNTALGEGQAMVDLQVVLDAASPGPAQIICTLTPDTFDGEPLHVQRDVDLPAGSSRHPLRLQVPAPHLWWPWDHGRPDLYRLAVQVTRAGRVLDIHEQAIGLRCIELDGWTLRVNGRPVYARGANWVPASILPGTVRQADYQALLELARAANANLLRVWGGGLREKAAFYDLCDRLGLLVWQEFPLACAFVTRFPRSASYLALVDAEARAIVRTLQAHPSLALWCGGNELDPARNAPVVDTLRRAVAAEDPARPFLPASPAGGDSHDWSVWHNFHPPSAYRLTRPGFASEFGLQAPPDVPSLRRFVPPGELWPPGPSWACHGAQLKKLWRYARPFLLGREVDLEAFVAASQRAQAEGLRVGIEHYRRLKAEGNGGAIVWQLNEPWPAISWALVDHYRQPKPAYQAVRRAFQPLLISLDYPPRAYRPGDLLPFHAWVINDRPQPLPGCRLQVALTGRDGHVVQQIEQAVDVDATSARIVAQARWPLPEGGGWHLAARLHQDGVVLSENDYDLEAHDSLHPTLRQRLWAWLTGRVVPS